MQSRNLRQHLLQERLWLLRLLTQKLDRPLLALAEERKERIEQLVAGHARHTLVLALWRLGLCALGKKEKKTDVKEMRNGKKRPLYSP
jgi:hypothetical protein